MLVFEVFGHVQIKTYKFHATRKLEMFAGINLIDDSFTFNEVLFKNVIHNNYLNNNVTSKINPLIKMQVKRNMIQVIKNTTIICVIRTFIFSMKRFTIFAAFTFNVFLASF